MSATLDYGSVSRWVDLMIRAERLSVSRNYDFSKQADCEEMLSVIVQTAQSMGFSLAVGDRWWHLGTIAKHIDEQFGRWIWDTDRDTYLNPVKPKPSMYYVRFKYPNNGSWHYMKVGYVLGRYDHEQFQLTWNGVYAPGSSDNGALFRSQSRADCERVREAAIRARCYEVVQVTTKAPEGD